MTAPQPPAAPAAPAAPNAPGGLRGRLFGLALFLCVPLVLALLLVRPLGDLASIVAALAIMAVHAPVARAFMGRYGVRRCLWCGRAVTAGPAGGEPLELALPRGRRVQLAACSPAHAHRVRQLGAELRAGLAYVAPGIAGPVGYYVAATLVLALALGSVPAGWDLANRAVFRGGVALAVLALSSRIYRHDPAAGGPVAFPFPVHNLFLLGAGWVMWLFRLVGIWWLMLTVRDLVGML